MSRAPGPHPKNRRQRFPPPRSGTAPALADAVSGVATVSPHHPIMLREVLGCLQPAPGDLVVDATLGGGGHAQALLAAIQPHGRLLGLDRDSLELPRTAARLTAAGWGPGTFTARHASFADLPRVLSEEQLGAANAVLVDLGVSSMQFDSPARGFSYKSVGPLDMRLDPSSGETAADLLARLDEEALAALLVANADEPHACLIAALVTREHIVTTHALARLVRVGLSGALPALSSAVVKASVRRTLQALRIAVNDEFTALDRLLDVLPACLAPGGCVAILTFHSGEDRRVKKAFQAGHRTGVYAEVAGEVIRSTVEETRANRRASSAKLRWAVRAAGTGPPDRSGRP
ncbi:MAG: 16S rRNA (cytosine(1402)-N(4))-methyltransferase RsmH [Acidobacteria bacterium]|nr:16S rRNA (cytosine(1402)-N(4))-methyltransferase RsmH [Acidobacteriota bacterium]